MQVDRLQPAANRRVELRDSGLLDDAVLRGEEQVRAVFVRAGVDDRLDLLPLVQRDEVDEGGAAGGALLHRDLVSAEAVYPAAVREEQQVGMGGGGQQVRDVVVVAQVAALHAPTAPTLPAERVGGDRLDVALLRQDDDDFFVFDEIERVEVAGVDGEASPPLVAIALAQLAQLVLDDRAELLLAPQDRLELLDLLAEVAELVAQLLALELREPPELHVEDEVRLDLAELERLLHEPGAGGVDVGRGSDELDDRVDHVEGAYEPFDDVLAFTRLVDPVLRTPRHHFHLVRDVHEHRLRQVQQLRDPVDERQHVHREARLHRRVLVELVQDDLRIGVAA